MSLIAGYSERGRVISQRSWYILGRTKDEILHQIIQVAGPQMKKHDLKGGNFWIAPGVT